MRSSTSASATGSTSSAMVATPQPMAEPITNLPTNPVVLDAKAFVIKVVLFHYKQHGNVGWLDRKMRAGSFDEPGVGRFTKRLPLLPAWHEWITQEWQPGLLRALRSPFTANVDVERVKSWVLTDPLDLSNKPLSRIRARPFLERARVTGWDGQSVAAEDVAGWPRDVGDLLGALAVEIEAKKREEEDHARRLSKIRQRIDEDLKARVLKWRLAVLPEDPAEARFWVEEEPITFKRPDLDMTRAAAAELGAARGQGGPLNECTASNIASSRASIRAVDGRNVKEEVFTPPGAADSNVVSNSRTQSAKRKRGE